ncbi:ORF161 [Staphylococcus phage 42E]|uniref:ORF161 n=1 Tax=Staphylococcus phage 42E TaxID=2908113 RepID=Q4ZCZ0_9CAUD|nr:ORF161 [Staphylococcus phage 42E]AAX91187.1 ORF161 [Staphylococcus phage 42E]
MQSASYCFTQVSPLHGRIGYRKCGFKLDWLLVM